MESGDNDNKVQDNPTSLRRLKPSVIIHHAEHRLIKIRDQHRQQSVASEAILDDGGRIDMIEFSVFQCGPSLPASEVFRRRQFHLLVVLLCFVVVVKLTVLFTNHS
jgi:hypothetical protein